MSKILFINPNTRYLGRLFTVLPPQGILYISAVLLKVGYTVKIIDADIEDLSIDGVKSYVRSFSPDYIAITMNTIQLRAATDLAKALKEITSVKIIVGGPHPSALKAELLTEYESLDIAIIGEGERTFLDLVKTLENGKSLENVDGICYRESDEIKTNQPREFIKNIDSLPFPALHLVEPLKRYPGAFPVGARPSIQIMASRGCPFRCSFCSNPVWGHSNRLRSTDSILLEIMWLKNTFKVKEIFFVDDTLNVNRKWFESLCYGIIDNNLNKDIRFKSPFRVNKNILDLDMLKLAKRAGFWMIFYGVESGNQTILDNINKNITLSEIERAFALTKKAKIKSLASFMIGNLGETPKTIQDTIEFAKKIDPDYYGFGVAIPYPGSELYSAVKKQNLLLEKFENFTLNKNFIAHSSLSSEEIEISVNDSAKALYRYKQSLMYTLKKLLSGDISIEKDPFLDYYCIENNPNESLLENTIVMGKNDLDALGPGWYCLECIPEKIRWTHQKAIAYLRKTEEKTFNIKIITFFPNMQLKITAESDSHLFALSPNQWQILTIPLKNEDISILQILLEVDRTWIPDNLYNNDDYRKLGIAVEKIWLD